MRISSMSFHALHLLLQLACQSDGTPLSASELAASCGISEHFIQKILRCLQSRGIVRSIRGIAGGHMLARTPGAISLADIILAVEGGISLPETGGTSCSTDVISNVWSLASQRVLEELGTINLTTVLERHKNIPKNLKKTVSPLKNAAEGRHPSLARLRCKMSRRSSRHVLS